MPPKVWRYARGKSGRSSFFDQGRSAGRDPVVDGDVLRLCVEAERSYGAQTFIEGFHSRAQENEVEVRDSDVDGPRAGVGVPE